MKLRMIWDEMLSGQAIEATLDSKGVLRIEVCIRVSKVGDLI